MTLPDDLKHGKVYIIVYKREKDSVFTGTFNRYLDGEPSVEFIHVSAHFSIGMHDRISFYHYHDYYYYDIERIKNAQYARRNMEQRSLSMILKKIVNEEFEW
jgi:hypothetical protein